MKSLNVKHLILIPIVSSLFGFYVNSATSQQPTAILVNSADDPGTAGDNFVTLREAMLFATGKATASGGETAFVPGEYGANHADMIQFDLSVFPPETTKSIMVIGSGLPPMETSNDTIDGSNSSVVLDFMKLTDQDQPFVIASERNCIMGLQIINAPVSGIWVFGNDNTIGGDRSIGKGPLGQGNQIGGCRDNGIWISGMQGGGQRNVIKGNLIGTDRTGKTANSNQNGINLGQGASDNVIGGTSLSTTNVISGNLISGISTSQETMNNHIIGNYIGTDISGTMVIKNGLSGIQLTPGVQRMFIGGKETGEGNVINNNSGDGIMMNGNVEDVQIIGNTIINNKGMGINMFGSGAQDQFEGEIRSVIIEGNIIGKNNWGIWLGFDVFGTIIRNNFIGIMPDESIRIANQVDGIWNSGASDTYIGPGNRIFYNAQHGVNISQGSGIRVTRNSISRNTGLGICLGEEGIVVIQSPIIMIVDSTQVSGTSNTPDGSVVEIFNDPQDEGHTFLGSATVSEGKFTFSGTIPTTGNITATVTDPDGNTSAFSEPRKNPYAYATPTPTRTPQPTATPRPTATPTLPASSNTAITVESVTAKPGEKIQVPVSIVKSPSVDAFQFELTFDPNILTYQSVSKEGTLSKDFILVDGNVLEPGKLRVAGSAFTAAPFSGDGVIVHVLFQIDASAADGETPLTLSNLRDDIQGAKTVPGKVVVSTFVPGDVNGDGLVSAGDAQLAFEFAIGKKQPTDAQIKAGDMDGNGEITAGDAQKIFFLSIGKSAKARGRALSGIFPASAQKVSAITTSGKPGDEIWLPIAVQGANNVLAFTFDLTFDAAALEYQGINYANTLSAAFLLVGGNEVSSGRLRVGGAAFTAPAINGDGTLVLVGFKIKSGASGAYPITLDNLRDDIAGATTEAGQILAGIENTPTPTSTPTPILQVSPTPNGTVIGLQPLRVFPLESTSEFTEIPGGFSNPPAPGGTVTIGEIPKQGGMTDGVGASIVTQPGQLGFLMFPSIDVGGNTVLIRASVRSNGPGAAVALAVLDGSLDGSIATNIPSNSALFQGEYKRMVLLYDPPGTSIVPVFQVSNLQGTQAIQVNLDNYEIYLIPPEGTVPAPLLNGK